MQQQFTKVGLLVVAFIVVGTIASLATAVVMLSGSQNGDDGEGSVGSTRVQFGIEQAGDSLGAQFGEAVAPSARGKLKERANVMFSTREVTFATRGGSTREGRRGRVKGQVFLDVFVNDQGKVTVQTRGGFDGLPSGEYGLWLEPPEEFQRAGLQPRLLQTASARSTKGLKLNRDATQSTLSLTELPVAVKTLEGFTLSIRQVQDGIGPESVAGPALVSRTITRIVRYP